MRTTVTIDDDVLSVARALAKRNGVSVGRALSELARRGFRMGAAVARRKRERGTVFSVDPDAGPITNEDTRGSLSDWP